MGRLFIHFWRIQYSAEKSINVIWSCWNGTHFLIYSWMSLNQIVLESWSTTVEIIDHSNPVQHIFNSFGISIKMQSCSLTFCSLFIAQACLKSESWFNDFSIHQMIFQSVLLRFSKRCFTWFELTACVNIGSKPEWYRVCLFRLFSILSFLLPRHLLTVLPHPIAFLL